MIVVGGALRDSKDGVRNLAKYGIEAIPVAVSPNPLIQAKRHRQPILLAAKVRELLSGFSPQPIVVNCVSMSFALDWKRLYLPGYEIYELTSVFYQHIILNPMLQHSTLGLIVADGITLRRILAFFEQVDFLPPLMAFADLGLINLYESSPAQGKRKLLKIIDRLVDLGATDVILGCTHLSDENLPDELDGDVRVIQPGLLLLQDVVKYFQQNDIPTSPLLQPIAY